MQWYMESLLGHKSCFTLACTHYENKGNNQLPQEKAFNIIDYTNIIKKIIRIERGDIEESIERSIEKDMYTNSKKTVVKVTRKQ